jgi:hypothetical protein
LFHPNHQPFDSAKLNSLFQNPHHVQYRHHETATTSTGHHHVRISEQGLQNTYTNRAASNNNTMTNTLTPALSPQAETSPLLTAAALAAYQRTLAANPSTISPRGTWVCGGQMYHRPTPPSDKRWNKLVKKDDLAAEIDDILRAATTNTNDGEGN